MKRRLSNQQNRRISKAQSKRVSDVHANLGAEQEGVVVTHFGNSVDVEFNDQKIRCHARNNIGSIVVGDEVIFCIDLDSTDEVGIITARKERRSILTRPDIYKKHKDIAANIDQMFIVMAIEPEIVPHYVDKYLVAAELQNIKPILVLNKTDLLDPIRDAKVEQLVDLYEGIGYPTLHTSIHNDLSEIREPAKDKTSIFVGQSGVGKSALINSLFKTKMAKVGEISEQTAKGKHTTTRSHLYHLSSGGNIIDSPGIREFGLWDISVSDATRGFKEFIPFLDKCKFRNCTHENTPPGCAICDATNSGKIHHKRLESYFRLLAEIKGNT